MILLAIGIEANVVVQDLIVIGVAVAKQNAPAAARVAIVKGRAGEHVVLDHVIDAVARTVSGNQADGRVAGGDRKAVDGDAGRRQGERRDRTARTTGRQTMARAHDRSARRPAG